jgi:hypothetical protein
MRTILLLIAIAFIFNSPINVGLSQDVVNAIEIRQNDTNISISKAVEETGKSPIILKYTIKTPKVDDFDFVLALDSSGSFGRSGLPVEKDAVVKAIPEFIRYIIDKREYSDNNFSISLVSWDEKVNFAYGNFTNNNSSGAEIVPVKKAVEEINNSNLEKYYLCDEDSFTDLSIPISSALSILDNKTHPSIKGHRTSRFMILITGKGEYHKANQSLVEEFKRNNYPIYVIGLDVEEDTTLFDHLNLLAENNTNRVKFLRIFPSDPGQLEVELLKALEAHLDNATREPIMRNIKIDETLYPYVEPDMGSIEVEGNYLKSTSTYRRIADSHTSALHLELANGLMPNSETRITFRCNLNLTGMPVTVSDNQKDVIIYKPSQGKNPPPKPAIYFDWLNDELPHNQPLPTIYINGNNTAPRITVASSQPSMVPTPKIEVFMTLLKSLNFL